MKHFILNCSSLFERFIGCLFVFTVFPSLLLIGFVIRLITGGPAIVRAELPDSDAAVLRSYYRFRSTGSQVDTFLRRTSLDTLPALLSIARGDISMRDFWRLR